MPAKSTPKPSKRFPVILIILIALVVLSVGLLFGWTIYQGNVVTADKARFAQAERDVDTLSQAVVAGVGAPAKTESEKYCDRPNLKLDNGPLSCDIHWYGYYEVDTPEQATEKYLAIRKIFEAKWPGAKYENLQYGSSEAFRELDAANTTHEGDYDRILGKSTQSNGLKCEDWSGFYLGNNTFFKDSYNSDNSKYVLSIDLSCGDKAKIAHFPMKP